MWAKSRKYQGVFEVKSRVKTWQDRGIWSQQLKHKQVPQWGTVPGVRKGKRSLLACNTRCKCSMETTHNRWRSSSVSMSWNWWKVRLVWKSLLVKDQNVIYHSWEGYFILLNKFPVSTIKLPEWRFQAFCEVSLFQKLTGKSPGPQNKTFIRGASPGVSYKLRDKNTIGWRRWNIFKRSVRYPCLSSLLESRLALKIKHSYEEQARAYRISWEIKTP